MQERGKGKRLITVVNYSARFYILISRVQRAPHKRTKTHSRPIEWKQFRGGRQKRDARPDEEPIKHISSATKITRRNNKVTKRRREQQNGKERERERGGE